MPLEDNNGGGSDDIGDISWNMPTVTLRYPSNIPGLPGHNWSSGIASATPIAHKGVVAGAKVQAMTVLDLLTKPELVKGAWDYFNNVQTKDVKYIPFITRDTPPPTHLNKAILEKYREQMKKYLLRPDEVPDLSRSARHQVPDGAARQGLRSKSSNPNATTKAGAFVVAHSSQLRRLSIREGSLRGRRQRRGLVARLSRSTTECWRSPASSG